MHPILYQVVMGDVFTTYSLLTQSKGLLEVPVSQRNG